MLEHLKVAVIHEWFVDYSGSERVVEQILNIFPHADLFATVDFLPDRLRGFIQHKKVNTTFIQNLPFAKTKFRTYLPLMPLAIEQFDLSSYDLIISSCHAVAKGVLTGPDQLHIAYVHSPIRYAWDLQHQYLKESGLDRGIKSWLARWFLHQIRLWDSRTANGVDYFVANSQFIARRIHKVYRREARVIYPPVDVAAFTIASDMSNKNIGSENVSSKNIGNQNKVGRETEELERDAIAEITADNESGSNISNLDVSKLDISDLGANTEAETIAADPAAAGNPDRSPDAKINNFANQNNLAHKSTHNQTNDFYLTASRFVPYKKVDLIVAAFCQMPSKKLLVIGDGPNLAQIEAIAQNCPNIHLIGYQPPHQLKDYMRRAKAFVFAAEEDFGITPVEALACGTPVIAYGKGGVLETVTGLSHLHHLDPIYSGTSLNQALDRDSKKSEQDDRHSPEPPTGILFRHQTINSLIAAVENFELSYHEISPDTCRQSALKFAPERFRQEFASYVEQAWIAHFGDRLGS